jgi:cell division protein FtsI (penicillin-binding protein 3)
MFTVVAVVLLAILARVALLQTAEAQEYVDFGEQQRTREAVLTADRGVIFDRDGDELAISVPATTIFANPRLVVDAVGTASALAQMLLLTPDEEAALAQDLTKDREFVYVARQVDDAIAEAVGELDLPGVGLYDEPTRVFPAGDVARGVLGRTDVDGLGIGGLEKQYDDRLTGVPGKVVRERDGQGRSIPMGKRVLEQAVPGDDLVLTISRPIQYQAEQALIAMVEEIKARGGTAIVMDSKTGELYAMAGVRRDEETGTVHVSSANIAAVDAYEPGSVAKVVTISAALNEGAVTPETSYDIPGEKFYFDTWLHDAEVHGIQAMSVAQILAKSSNIGTITVSETIGITRQESYMRAFGLGEPTALGFPGESHGILKPSSEWQGTEQKTVAYGQGVAATAIQLISAINVVANGGEYVAPKLVRGFIDRAGQDIVTDPSPTHQVLRPDVAATMNVLMRDVICHGTASRAKVPGFTIAGKTGTGYKAQSNGTYFDANGHKAYYASFVGFLPAEDPRITILVSIDEPPADGPRFGGLIAAPVFTQIAETAIHQLHIQPPTATGGCPEG